MAPKRSSRRRLSAQLDAVLGALEIPPLEIPADIPYGSMGAQLERAGKHIGPNELLIAAQALTLG